MKNPITAGLDRFRTKKLTAGGSFEKTPASARTGFSDDAMKGLADLDARTPPPDAVLLPAFTPGYQRTQRLTKTAAAGGGMVTDDQGNSVPHYWGHRERLRTRFLTGGHKPMPEYEILELLLFNAITRIDVKPLPKRLLSTFGDLNGVTDKVFLELRIAEAFAQRMGQSKILEREILSSWDALISYCRTVMAHREVEQFRVLFLDRKNVIVADEERAKGTVDHVPVYPREVAKRALELNASAIILVHNHPSGDPNPSSDDIEVTEAIAMACQSIGVTIHDHVIVGKDREYSFKSHGRLG